MSMNVFFFFFKSRFYVCLNVYMPPRDGNFFWLAIEKNVIKESKNFSRRIRIGEFINLVWEIFGRIGEVTWDFFFRGDEENSKKHAVVSNCFRFFFWSIFSRAMVILLKNDEIRITMKRVSCEKMKRKSRYYF